MFSFPGSKSFGAILRLTQKNLTFPYTSRVWCVSLLDTKHIGSCVWDGVERWHKLYSVHMEIFIHFPGCFVLVCCDISDCLQFSTMDQTRLDVCFQAWVWQRDITCGDNKFKHLIEHLPFCWSPESWNHWGKAGRSQDVSLSCWSSYWRAFICTICHWASMDCQDFAFCMKPPWCEQWLELPALRVMPVHS